MGCVSIVDKFVSWKTGDKALPETVFRTDIESVQARFGTASDHTFSVLTSLASTDRIPPIGDPRRDSFLSQMITGREPILSGAFATMVAKAASMGYLISGPKLLVDVAVRVLANAENGDGWFNLVSKVAQDYYATDKGAFVELARYKDQVDGPVLGVYSLDSLDCEFTDDAKQPLDFYDRADDKVKHLRPEDFVRVTPLPSPRQTTHLGLCAVSRCVHAAQLLMLIYQYDNQKLSNVPPKAIATLTGLTQEQFEDALKKRKARRVVGEELLSDIFWLANPVRDVKLTLHPFSTLPENFDRREVITLYVYTVALCFAVDARELWPGVAAGATKADAVIQARKAINKFDILPALERVINHRIMPAGVNFAFRYQDAEQDLEAGKAQGQYVTNVMAMFNNGSGVVTADEARTLLATKEILPRTMVLESDIVVADIERKSFGSIPKSLMQPVLYDSELGAYIHLDRPKTIWANHALPVRN